MSEPKINDEAPFPWLHDGWGLIKDARDMPCFVLSSRLLDIEHNVAEEVVRRVNLHDELVEALFAAREEILAEPRWVTTGDRQTLRQIETALAKARGEQP